MWKIDKVIFIVLTTLLILGIITAIIFIGITVTGSGGYGIIKLSNGEVIEGEVDKIVRWSRTEYEVTINGITYQVHPENFTYIE